MSKLRSVVLLPSFGPFVRAFAAGAAVFAAGALHAQALPPGVRLGMTPGELQAAMPALERVQRPQRLAGGLIGSWQAAPVWMAGLVFEPIFFFADSQLRRVEFLASAQALPDGGAAAFAELLRWGRGAFGGELASNDPGTAYAAWTSEAADVYLQHVRDARRASVRLVYKARQVRDGSEL
ncbi:hypothetical protein EH244_23470 [Variovorax beijingensis]|uniref:Uncharacterized protein n=1 Tax=Variovorax beijingensis TaxID=2496117 RepID=A0A3P3EFD4_9BURK|nr:hypothetical protein EH244_23470 [Variovorax beijingensis]RSZ31078.1 hypothetical protein EJO66_24880 [Variovorax beijingensis]